MWSTMVSDATQDEVGSAFEHESMATVALQQGLVHTSDEVSGIEGSRCYLVR